MNFKKFLRRIVKFWLYGGFVSRNEGYSHGGLSEYRVISGNRKYYVVRRLIQRMGRPFRVKRAEAIGFTKF